ncbi:thioredoxin [Candidatus Poribacteria bacterium]|nr:MAG: thioredoxin [Candidatus Poribacteria bacterium]
MKSILQVIIISLILINPIWISAADEATLKNPDGTWKWTNRLINETSLYLLLHAHNPVDWYPWGDEALSRAKKENKPIFLSVGYSTCYWCHVMERKVFSNPDIAKEMNENFINIKIDREERPDLDEIYMTATQLLIQHGGWPNSVFLTPDLKPFYAGTYFPPTDQPHRPGFPTILEAVNDAWKTREAEVIESANKITQFIEVATNKGFTTLIENPIDRSLITDAVEFLKSKYDKAYGGFSTAPKFPSPSNLEFLLREYERQTKFDKPSSEDDSLLQMITHTLDMMAYGGIYDQIGGGFHRYSVDAKWLVPHFEKMLYDNALLAKLYLQTYHITKKPLYRRIAEEIFTFIQREMTHPDGGFYSAIDAETDAEEGKYYVWTEDEIKDVLDKKDVKKFNSIYGIDKGTNFEGKNVLYVPNTHKSETSILTLRSSKEKLLDARNERERPLLDTKILVNWNGLMIDALAYGYQVLEDEQYYTAASEAAQFILDSLTKPDGELWHLSTSNVAKFDGYLDDYAFFIQGLLTLHEASGEEKWLIAAQELTQKMIELFWDDMNGGFFYTKADDKQLIVRTKKPHDSAIPSGNAVAVNTLLILQEKINRLPMKNIEVDYREYAEKTLRSFAQAMDETPSSFMHMLYSLNAYLDSQDVENLPVKDSDTKPSTQPIVTAHANILTISNSSVIYAEIRITIKDGWHINANPTGQENLIPTTISVPDDSSISIYEENYPKGKSVKFEFSPDRLNVYEGMTTFTVKIRPKENITLKKNDQLLLKLNYQACNETMCLLPETLDIPLKIK